MSVCLKVGSGARVRVSSSSSGESNSPPPETPLSTSAETALFRSPAASCEQKLGSQGQSASERHSPNTTTPLTHPSPALLPALFVRRRRPRLLQQRNSHDPPVPESSASGDDRGSAKKSLVCQGLSEEGGVSQHLPPRHPPLSHSRRRREKRAKNLASRDSQPRLKVFFASPHPRPPSPSRFLRLSSSPPLPEAAQAGARQVKQRFPRNDAHQIGGSKRPSEMRSCRKAVLGKDENRRLFASHRREPPQRVPSERGAGRSPTEAKVGPSLSF